MYGSYRSPQRSHGHQAGRCPFWIGSPCIVGAMRHNLLTVCVHTGTVKTARATASWTKTDGSGFRKDQQLWVPLIYCHSQPSWRWDTSVKTADFRVESDASITFTCIWPLLETVSPLLLLSSDAIMYYKVSRRTYAHARLSRPVFPSTYGLLPSYIVVGRVGTCIKEESRPSHAEGEKRSIPK